MDREYPTSRAELDDKDQWPYNDLQSLASELDYGNPVGEDRDDLVEHAAAELDLPSTAPDRQVDREIDRQVDREGSTGEDQGETASRQDAADEPAGDSLSTPASDEGGSSGDPAATTDGGTQTAPSTDAIDVGHEGSEKLSPEGAPDSQGTAVEPPGDLEADDIDPDALESEPEADDVVDDVQEDSDSEQESEGGLRERLGIGSSDETPEDVVEEADDPDERQRREEMRQKFEGKMGGDGADQEDVDDAIEEADGETAPTTTPANGMMMDEEVVASMIATPFNSASAATGWDGWELTEEERRTNARLFIAMCDEKDIDVSSTTMFALSMAQTFGGKAIGYRRQKDDDEDVVDENQEFDDDVEDVAGQESRQPRGESTEQQGETTADEDFGF